MNPTMLTFQFTSCLLVAYVTITLVPYMYITSIQYSVKFELNVAAPRYRFHNITSWQLYKLQNCAADWYWFDRAFGFASVYLAAFIFISDPIVRPSFSWAIIGLFKTMHHFDDFCHTRITLKEPHSHSDTSVLIAIAVLLAHLETIKHQFQRLQDKSQLTRISMQI